MKDRYYSIVIVPEKSDQVKKFRIPVLYVQMSAFFLLFLMIAGSFIFFDYLHVLSQVAENKRLRSENFQLKHEIEEAKSRLNLLGESVSRIKVLSQKLKILGNLDAPATTKILERPASLTPNFKGLDEDSGRIEDELLSPSSPGNQKKRPQKLPPENPSENSSLEKNSDSISGALSQSGETATYSEDLSDERFAELIETAFGELTQSFDQGQLVETVRRITNLSSELIQTADLEEQRLVDMQDFLQDRADRLRSTPSILPAQGWISSEFGYRIHPVTGVRTFHAGLDIAGPHGTPIYAPADGFVTTTGFVGGFGQVIRIDHGYNIVTKYGHNSRILVQRGDRVRRGQKIAEMGSTGRSTGTHLHYQIEIRGRPVNPRLFILEDIF